MQGTATDPDNHRTTSADTHTLHLVCIRYVRKEIYNYNYLPEEPRWFYHDSLTPPKGDDPTEI